MPQFSTLNEAQLEAVTTIDSPVLLIAGAGSGKTRTIVHRIAYLHSKNVYAHQILLLTFTRKAAHEMLHRASQLLETDLFGLQGGTFHAFAYGILRQFPPSWANTALSILDSSDSAAIISHCKDIKKLGKKDRAFPKNQTLLSIFSKARNKELSIEEIISRESNHLLAYLEEIIEIEKLYTQYRKDHFLLDYDDLLFQLEIELQENKKLAEYMQERFKYIMVDEYQDTNKVQARLVKLCTGTENNIMAVGDDAQSIYAFRGATIQNILDFPNLFKDTKVLKLEENYRSFQSILNIANVILENASIGYQKNLFSKKEEKDKASVIIYRPLSDITQAKLVGKKISTLLKSSKPNEIAVLFRAGYQSYHLEVELNILGIGFKKYGGVKYTEAVHIKDVLAFARLLINPLDLPAFERIASLHKGVGPKTAHKIFSYIVQNDTKNLEKACAKYPDLWKDIDLLTKMQAKVHNSKDYPPEEILKTLIDNYQPRMEWIFPDDYPRRQQGLEELINIGRSYTDLALFMADLCLENPDDKDNDDHKIILSTIHSAKGLEWEHVLILDLVEDRFPSRHAITRADDYEEERRLLYVACTRAKESLSLFVPQNIFQRAMGFEERAVPSPFICEIPNSLYEEYFEQYGGVLIKKERKINTKPFIKTEPLNKSSNHIIYRNTKEDFKEEKSCITSDKSKINNFSSSKGKPKSQEKPKSQGQTIKEDMSSQDSKTINNKAFGYCTHKVFGRGKIIEEIDNDKIRVNFTGFGLKVIMKNYVIYE